MSIAHDYTALAADPVALLSTLNTARAARSNTLIPPGLSVGSNPLAQISWGSGESAIPTAGVNNLTFEQLSLLKSAAAGLVNYGGSNQPPWRSVTELTTAIIEEHLLEVAQVAADANAGKRCYTCSTSCANNCGLVCYITCSNSCGSDCTGLCSYGSCSGTCVSSCTACGNTCSGYFVRSCSTACSGGCGSGCEGNCYFKCTGSCSGPCQTTCAGNCYNGCAGTCNNYNCNATCYGNCYNSCTGSCGGTCSVGSRQFTDPGSL